MVMEIEKEKMHLGNVGGGLVEGCRAHITEGGLVWVTNERTLKGGNQNRLFRDRADPGPACIVERLEVGGGELRQPVNKSRLVRSGINPQSRGGLGRILGECEYRWEKWKLVKRFENMRGVIERYRSGECVGVARVGVNLKSSEIEWHWKEEMNRFYRRA